MSQISFDSVRFLSRDTDVNTSVGSAEVGTGFLHGSRERARRDRGGGREEREREFYV